MGNSTQENGQKGGSPSPQRLGSACVQKFWTGINCPNCEKGEGKGPCPDLWIQDNGDGLISDGDVGYCDECGKHFSLLVDAYEQVYAYVDDDEQNTERHTRRESEVTDGQK